ncbi:MAG: pyridoxal phosphate-dependent aminotransferase [Janthinobacterium lividum]
MRFATRTDFGTTASEYGEALRAARARGSFTDLTVSNPTQCGLALPAELLQPLADAGSLRYAPEALGLSSARDAIARLYREHWYADVPADQLLLTASTSEAYSYLLRLFCEPGDAVLVPSPSYPLFDLLARLHDVELIHYPLVYHDGWQIDPQTLRSAVTPRTRAIVVIHPNNPTGHFCSAADRDLLLQCAQEYGLPLIVDEVFLDYAVEHGGAFSFASQMWHGSSGREQPVLTFVMGGLSKLLCMPQMKLAWTAVAGPQAEVAETMNRLEVIADTFLSVSSPAQLALPFWLKLCTPVQEQVLQRVGANLALLDAMLPGTAVSRLKVEGGWAAVLRLPANDLDTEFSIRLLQQAGVAVHPGSFYGFPPRGWVVVSLLTAPDAFQRGLISLIKQA